MPDAAFNSIVHLIVHAIGLFSSVFGGTFLEENRFPQTPSKDLWVSGTA